MKNLGTKIWKIFDEQKFFHLKSLNRIVGFAESRLHLGNTQINLVLRSICTTFALQKVKTKKLKLLHT